MNKQQLFNDAYYEYINAVNDIKQMCEELNKKPEKLIYGFDILIQISLMKLLEIDKCITNLEIEFLSKMMLENDLMKLANEKGGFEISWEKLLELRNDKSYKMLVEHIYKLFEMEISSFILSFLSLDLNILEDHLNRLKGYVYNISMKFLSVDGLTKEEEELCYRILNDFIFEKMDNIKNSVLLIKKPQ
ncbi:MAG: hypothetical protein ACI35W_01240 [Anaeroplasmataceae bacterium]